MGVLGIVEVTYIMFNPNSTKFWHSRCDQVDLYTAGTLHSQFIATLPLHAPPKIDILSKPGRKAMAG
jgi:hypothetical protein